MFIKFLSTTIERRSLVRRLATVLSLLGLTLAVGACGFGKSNDPYVYRYERGKSGVLRDGRILVPKKAPEPVKRAAVAGNRLQGKPYVYGGGHARLEDRGYDCSGTVSYALINAKLLKSPMGSSDFRKYGRAGKGKWITIYAKKGHVFVTVCGVRLDTGYGGGSGPAWQTKSRPAKGYSMRHPPGL